MKNLIKTATVLAIFILAGCPGSYGVVGYGRQARFGYIPNQNMMTSGGMQPQMAPPMMAPGAPPMGPPMASMPGYAMPPMNAYAAAPVVLPSGGIQSVYGGRDVQFASDPRNAYIVGGIEEARRSAAGGNPQIVPPSIPPQPIAAANPGNGSGYATVGMVNGIVTQVDAQNVRIRRIERRVGGR